MKSPMTVKKQLTLTFGALVVLIALVAGFATYLLNAGNQKFYSYVHGINARALLAEQVRTAVDRRAIAARNMTLLGASGDMTAEYKEVLAAHKAVQERVARLQRLVREAKDASPKAAELIDRIAEVESRYAPVALGVVDLANRRQSVEATQKILDECRPLLAELIASTNAYREYTAERSTALVEQAQSAYLFDRNTLIAAASLALAFAILCGWAIVRSLIHTLGSEPAQLSAVARVVASGDLSDVHEAPTVRKSSVLASLAEMQRSLQMTVLHVRQAAESIFTGAAEIASGNENLSQRTEEQASALEETAATMDQIASTVQNNAANSAQAARMAAHSLDAVKGSNAIVQRVVNSMSDINASSKRIEDIVGVIDSIAFQTNILALNAAVEAARAGDQGKGFGVVAAEVRNLAKRSAGAAGEIKQLISQSVITVGQGVSLAEEAGASMTDAAGSVTALAELVEQISHASQEQALGVAQVGEAVNQMDRVTQQNAALVEEAAAAAGSLRSQAQQLLASVQAFSLGTGANRGALPIEQTRLLAA
ncbi:methyl-accepting chemotaxis protein [uncultured Xylophilus sp.]|uniref:methyl-accepting chemotaxis protein n=1 Tax=uncultured Xylophilus sp. TaxID=296832 RepID=UPI0025D5F2DB|nr:methyl-accepting chemotaxis protein [uncultured Xylophilus sp.]